QFPAWFGIGGTEALEYGVAFGGIQCGRGTWCGQLCMIIMAALTGGGFMVHCRMTSKWLIAGILATITAIAYAEPVTLERDSALRAEPRMDAGVVANLSKGSTGDAVARQGAWVQIKS